MKRFIASALCTLLLPLSAHAWWDSAWTARHKVTLDTQAAAIAADVTDVPVLLRLSSGNFDFLGAADNGADIRFVAEDDKTVLPHHIERYDATNELAFVWVKVPRLAAANNKQHVWLYVGNEKATPAPAGTYDASTWAVYHLNDNAGAPQDASAGGNHAQALAYTPVPAGLIAGAARLNGDGGLKASATSLQNATGFTWSAWVKPARADGELLAYGALRVSLAGGGVPVLSTGSGTARGTEALALNTWHHVAVTHGAEAVLYVNGRPVGRVAQPFAPTANLTVGAGLVGELDEVQVSTTARTEAWVAVQADSQGMATKLVKVANAEATEGGEAETGYLMATLNNLTVDGWVVTIICVLMLIYAIFLMAAKGMLLSKQEKANPRFTEAFDKLARELPSLGRHADIHAAHLETLALRKDDYRDSPLHRIYQVGVRELKFRFDQFKAEQDHTTHMGLPSISERAMLAVRASLDAQMTRERQRLDNQMVLLTIAISGGPFLGLLGTVVGVMITFAAIAAAGDVNVNAIAPGIAAALVATVAGLGVAIPALFGYNYLQTKIKSIGTDMTVFVDEFVTKMAETYGD